MVSHNNQSGITLSILDRLTDLEPESGVESRTAYWEEMRQFRNSLCRDLTALLNTRRAENDFDPSYVESSNSVLTFGIADFTSYNLKNSIEQERLRLSVERAIRQFEPRLTRVSVEIEPPDSLKPVLRFQVSAMLRADPAGEGMLFDATLYRDSRRFAVTGSNS